MNDTVLRGFLILGRQELVEHPVEAGEFADFVVGNQVDAVQTAGDGFESAAIAVVAGQVAEQTSGYFRALGVAGGGDSSDGGVQAVGGKFAFGQDFFYSCTLF